MSARTGAKPVPKESENLLYRLPEFAQFPKEWTRAGHLQPEVANKVAEWLDSDLQEWDISRDAPYFGFEIPGQPGKYFYVWLDAPIGYIARDRKSTRLNSSHVAISYAVFCLKKKEV